MVLNATQDQERSNSPSTQRKWEEPGRAKEGRLKPAESNQQFPGRQSLFGGRKSLGEREIKQRVLGGKAFSCSWRKMLRKSFALAAFAPFQLSSVSFCFVLFRSVSFVSHFSVVSFLVIVQINHNNASPA
jgi:hypothetical protein